MTNNPHDTVTELLNDPKLVDRLKEIRDGIANLERLNAALDTLWAEVKSKPGVSPEERARMAREINEAKELLRRSGIAVNMVRAGP